MPVFKQSRKVLDRALYWHYPHYHAGGDGTYSAIRSGDWRLVEFHEDNRLELFNLANDLGEQHNLAGENKQKAAELHAKLLKWRKSVEAQMPTPNPDFDPSKAETVRGRLPRKRQEK